MEEPIAYIEFVDGIERPVWEVDSRQFVIDDGGRPVFGIWYDAPEETPVPIIVPAGPRVEF
jgi:hypothetical protein